MTQPPGAGSGRGVQPALAFAVAGVLPDGDAAPRMCWRRAGAGYRDDPGAPGEVVAIDDGVVLRFALPAEQVDFILVEPAAVAGRYRIPRMAYAGSAVTDLRRRLVAANGQVGDDAASGLHVTTRDERPALEFDVRDLGADTGAPARHVELVLRRESGAGIAMDALAEVLASMAREREAGRAESARLARALAALSARLDGIAGVIGTPVEASGTPSVIDSLAAATARDARLAALESRLAELGDALARSQDALSALAPMIELEGRSGAAADAHLGQQLEVLQSQLDRLVNSVENVFWRRWLRRLRGGAR